MRKNTESRVLEAIRNRKDLEMEKISVRKLLRVGDMEAWTSLCCDRIADIAFLEEKDVVIGFEEFPDFELTSNGMLT